MKTTDYLNISNQIELIGDICSRIPGIGKSKAFVIAEDFEGNWKNFLKTSASRLLLIKKSNGEQYLTKDQAIDIVANLKDFKDHDDVRDAWIFLIGKDFLVSQIQTLESFSLAEMDINPLLMKVLDLNTPREIIEFNLYQSVTRSVVTSWGSAVEKLVARCGAVRFETSGKTGRAGRRPDIIKSDGKTDYYIQIKSGPNTMNVDMVNSLNEVIKEYKEKSPKNQFILGMTYGKRNRISGQISANLTDFEKNTLIGRELWDFISEKENFHRKIFALLDKSAKNVSKMSFEDRLELKIEELTAEWDAKFKSNTTDQVFEKYI